MRRELSRLEKRLKILQGVMDRRINKNNTTVTNLLNRSTGIRRMRIDPIVLQRKACTICWQFTEAFDEDCKGDGAMDSELCLEVIITACLEVGQGVQNEDAHGTVEDKTPRPHPRRRF